MKNGRITFRIRERIREAFKKKIEKSGESPSAYITRLICEDLGMSVPVDGRTVRYTKKN